MYYVRSRLNYSLVLNSQFWANTLWKIPKRRINGYVVITYDYKPAGVVLVPQPHFPSWFVDTYFMTIYYFYPGRRAAMQGRHYLRFLYSSLYFEHKHHRLDHCKLQNRRHLGGILNFLQKHLPTAFHLEIQELTGIVQSSINSRW